MLIREFAGAEAQAPRIMALAEFLARRAKDQAVEPRISVSAFVELASNLGISITDTQLRDMIQQPPLNGVIKNISGGGDDGEVIFRDADQDSGPDQGEPEITPDLARDTVDSMSKRAALKDL